MPRLVVLTEQMVSPHGTQMLAALMADQAVRAGFEVVLYTARYDPARSSWTRFLAERGVDVVSAGFWKLTRWQLPHRWLAARLWRCARRRRPDLIWAADNEPFTCHALASRPVDAPPFVVHDPSEASARFPGYPPLWFQVCHRVDGLSVHGQRQLRSAREYYGLRAPVAALWPASMPPGPAAASPRGAAPLRFGQLGRLHEHKGCDVALLALARLRDRGIAAELHVHGDGPQGTELERLRARLGLEDRVHFHGVYDWQDLDALSAPIDVGLLPSRCEGFGIVMLELMSRARPVIASDVGSSEEVLGRMGGGWVVPAADPGALAACMQALCRAPERVLTAGHAARELWSRHFRPEHMFRRHLRFWRQCGARI